MAFNAYIYMHLFYVGMILGKSVPYSCCRNHTQEDPCKELRAPGMTSERFRGHVAPGRSPVLGPETPPKPCFSSFFDAFREVFQSFPSYFSGSVS